MAQDRMKKFSEMDISQRVEAWKQLNSTFNKTCVDRLGIDAGFFSEYRGMVDILLYCLENRIKFKLCSKWANFGYDKGWTDYFEPFCEEVDDDFHRHCNTHWRLPLKEFIGGEGNLTFQNLKWKLKLEFYHWVGLWYKKRNDIDYYTQDINEKNRPINRTYKIPQWQFEGNYAEAFRLINSFIWRYNEATMSEINEIIATLNLPATYLSTQIRGGDKFIEFPLLSVDRYIRRLRELSDVKDVYVLTDDYRIITELREKAPDYRWYTLCQPKEAGYYNDDFVRTDPMEKKRKLIRFFASIECLKASSLFLGSITTGPSGFIALLKYPDVHFVDIDTSSFLQTLDMPRREVKRLINEYEQSMAGNALAGEK